MKVSKFGVMEPKRKWCFTHFGPLPKIFGPVINNQIHQTSCNAVGKTLKETIILCLAKGDNNVLLQLHRKPLAMRSSTETARPILAKGIHIDDLIFALLYSTVISKSRVKAFCWAHSFILQKKTENS
jgi:hypothetical protein